MRGKELLLLRGTLGGNEEPISDIHKQEISIPKDVLNGSFKVYNISRWFLGLHARLLES